MTEHFTSSSENNTTQNHLAVATMENSAKTQAVKEALGDFSPWTATPDDPRWALLENNPNEVAELSFETKQAQEQQARSDEVHRLQALPNSERGGAWDFTNTRDMNMNGDPLLFYNPDAVRQFETQRQLDGIEAAIQESRKGIVKKAAGAALRGIVGVTKR